MKKLIALTVILPFISSMGVAQIGQFQSIYDAMAIKTNEVQTNNGWERIDKIKGVKWQWQRNKIADHQYTMSGEMPLKFKQTPHHYINPTSIYVTGMRSMIQSIEISVDDENINDDFNPKTLFNGVTVTRILTKCDMTDSALETSEFYKITKAGYKPIYLNYGYSRGTHDGSYFAKLNYELECK